MKINLDNITYQQIIDAVNYIEHKNIKLSTSLGYDVIINNKPYPPKEIIRKSYKLSTGKELGTIYGGEQVNKILRDLGFEIRRKTTIWKLGSNWGSGAPSFYNFIKDNEIVIGVDKINYNVGDLVLVTEGFTVYAIAKILEPFKPITSNDEFENYCTTLQIDYEKHVTYAKAEWYILSETDRFNYELQQGICKVKKSDIIEHTFNLWEFKKSKLSQNTFFLKNSSEPTSLFWDYPCLVLSKNIWDDYGHKTSYELVFYKNNTEKVEIGILKILQKNAFNTTTPFIFNSLDKNYCSLGMTIDYYKRLKSVFPDSFLKILRALNDCAFFENIKNKFINIDGFNQSLLRSTEAQYTLSFAKSIIEGDIGENNYNFNFEYKIDGALDSHKVGFSFNNNLDLPNRFICIVGKNATGKTRIISQLANKLNNDKEEGEFTPNRPSFTKIITASFSYFDNFKFPENQDISYEFIGIKSKIGILSEKEISNIVWNAYKLISKDPIKRYLWAKSIKSSMETEYLGFNLDEIFFLSTRKEFNEKVYEIFSSGQKIIFQFITRLISVIDVNSLLIFDEPETHLHPNIAGRLLRTLNNILEESNSFCILSTHSPIIIQEIPSKYIRIFDRHDNFPVIYNPTIECFGENLSNISNSIFRANEEKELYKIVLEDLVSKYSIEEIESKFNNKLSLNAKLFIQSISIKKNVKL